MSLGLLLLIVLIIFLFGGFSGRFGGYGYGYGHGGVGLIGAARASPAGSVRSNRHLGSKFGQPDAEQPFPLTGTRKRSGFAKAYDWVLASWDWLPAPGEAVMARPMTVATHAAAAVLTMGLLMLIGLNIRSPCSSWRRT